MFLSNQKPNVLQVVLNLEFVGERMIASLARALSNEFNVSFCCLDQRGLLGEELQKEGFVVHALNRQPGFDKTLNRKIADICLRYKIDLIHAHHYSSFFYSALARCIYGQPRLIFTEHGRPYPDIVSLKRKLANLFLSRYADAFTAVSEASRQGLCKNEWLPLKRTRVIYNGISLDKNTDYDVDASKIKQITDWIGPSQKVVGFLARLDPIKCPEVAIKAFAKVTERIPDAKLVMVGRLDPKHNYNQVVANLKIGDKVLFTGLLKNPYPVLKHFRVLIAPSLYEAASLAILEAMMYGIPVVASRTGGNPELVPDGETGYLAEVGDINGFTQALIQLLENEDISQKFGESSRKRIAEKFTTAQMANEYRNLFHQILNSNVRNSRNN